MPTHGRHIHLVISSQSNNRRYRYGFTLVETLVALGVLGIFFLAITLILQKVLENVGVTRIRTTALALAQQKMEIVQNVPYTNVGTVGGIPQGSFLPTEMVTINNLPFTVKTSVSYVDDPYDGVAPADSINTDYKRVRIEITWGGVYPSRVPLSLVTNIVPKGLENTVGGGTLYIQVLNSNGLPIPNATVTIDNTTVVPAIHTQSLTNINGLLILPGSPACISCYTISATKTNFSQDKTYSTTEVANPLNPVATLIQGKVTQVTLSIDQLSSLQITSVGPAPSYSPIANVLFTIKGSKIIGYTPSSDPVYKYQYSTNTGGSIINIPNLEWDTYTLDFTNSAHMLAGSNPVMPIAIPPGSSSNMTVVARPKTNTTLLVVIKDSSGTLQSSASARLINAQTGYNQTIITASTGSADYGQAFFNSLATGTYSLKINLPGFTEATNSMDLTSHHTEYVTLNRN